MSEGSQAKGMARELGIRKGMSMAVMNPPYGFVQSLMEIRESLKAMHADVKMNESMNLDMIVYFCRSRKGLEEVFPKLAEQLKPEGVLWIGYLKPKALKSDLSGKVVREIAQKYRMTDDRAMAFSDEWPMIRLTKAEGR